MFCWNISHIRHTIIGTFCKYSTYTYIISMWIVRLRWLYEVMYYTPYWMCHTTSLRQRRFGFLILFINLFHEGYSRCALGTLWRLFQTSVRHTRLDIYGFIQKYSCLLQQRWNNRGSKTNTFNEDHKRPTVAYYLVLLHVVFIV